MTSKQVTAKLSVALAAPGATAKPSHVSGRAAACSIRRALPDDVEQLKSCAVALTAPGAAALTAATSAADSAGATPPWPPDSAAHVMPGTAIGTHSVVPFTGAGEGSGGPEAARPRPSPRPSAHAHASATHATQPHFGTRRGGNGRSALSPGNSGCIVHRSATDAGFFFFEKSSARTATTKVLVQRERDFYKWTELIGHAVALMISHK